VSIPLCIFCSRRANSKEDLWPKWLVEFVVQHRSSRIEMEFANRPPLTFAGKYVLSRCVCKTCNEGWMSKLETGTKPILAPLISDSPCPLDYVQQLALSVWTTKTAMVYECVREKGEPAFYSAADREHLLTRAMPPPDTLIWIGRYEDSYSLFVEGHDFANPGNENVLSKGYVATFAMGRLIIQIFTARRGLYGDGPGGIDVARKEGDLIQIWPFREQFVRWPPPLSFGPSEEDLKELAKRIGGQR